MVGLAAGLVIGYATKFGWPGGALAVGYGGVTLILGVVLVLVAVVEAPFALGAWVHGRRPDATTAWVVAFGASTVAGFGLAVALTAVLRRG